MPDPQGTDEALTACGRCYGDGKSYVLISQDEQEPAPCGACNGTGRDPERSAALARARQQADEEATARAIAAVEDFREYVTGGELERAIRAAARRPKEGSRTPPGA